MSNANANTGDVNWGHLVPFVKPLVQRRVLVLGSAVETKTENGGKVAEKIKVMKLKKNRIVFSDCFTAGGSKIKHANTSARPGGTEAK